MHIAKLSIFVLLTSVSSLSIAENDSRQKVELPEMMHQHMISNMLDHLAANKEIHMQMSSGELDQPAQKAEQRLGMSSLGSHGANHMAKFMPQGMRNAGTSMHKAASRFSVIAGDGVLLPAYKVLSEVTSACVACHSGYRIR